MPTILELFKGSNKDITPKPSDETPIEKKFKGSTQEKSVKSDQLSKIEQEFIGVRFKSGVELNNPLLYGNQAIRIATRSTSDVEKMKQATGGDAATGGLIGQGLGKITGGKFGKFVFGGKVTSLNQARDGINTRLGIPTNLIPTYVYNTGGLQAGIEPDTMITLGNIKKSGEGTLLGKFLKQTGGGNPKTLGNQIIGGGVSLLKGKLRTTLFGNPAKLGSNTASASDSFSGVDSGGKSAKMAWEYSSKLPYSKQINLAKYNTKSVDGYVEGTQTNIIKKVTDLQLDAKKKLGEASANATASLKQRLKGTESKPEIDKVLESKTKETTATAKTYEEKNSGFVIKNSVETNLKLPELEKKAQLEKEKAEAEEAKKKLGQPEGITKPKLTGKESKSELDKVTESKTKETSATPKTYTEKIGDYKNEDVTKRINLSLVSPIKGIDRRKTKGRFGTTEYALFDPKNTTGIFSPNDPTRKYTGVVGSQPKANNRKLTAGRGLTNDSDSLNLSYVGKSGVDNDFGDLIPLRMSSVSDNGTFIHFRAIITGLNETSSPSWDSAKFVGNPYNFYTYNGVERSLNFTLRTYCMSLDELGLMWERLNWLTSQTYPKIVNKLVQPPFIRMTVGSIYTDKVGFINSLSYTINDDVTWETEIKNNWLPKVVDVQLEFKVVENAGVEQKPLYGYGISTDAVNAINNKRAAQTSNVIGQDPITRPKAPSDVNFRQVQSITELNPTPAPKVNNTSVDQTTPPPPVKDNTPKNIDTGKPVETPETSENPAVIEQHTKTAQSEITKQSVEAPKEYKEYPQWAWSTFKVTKLQNRGGSISNITKIDENNYYFKAVDGVGNEDDYVIQRMSDTSGFRQAYFVWSAANDGKDPMGLLKKSESTSSENLNN